MNKVRIALLIEDLTIARAKDLNIAKAASIEVEVVVVAVVGAGDKVDSP